MADTFSSNDEAIQNPHDSHNSILDMTVRDLLKQYPDGFAVSHSGTVSKIVMATSYFSAIAVIYPALPSNGGYLVVELVE